MIKIHAGYEYWVQPTHVDRVIRTFSRRHGGEVVQVERLAKRVFLAALHKMDDLTARLTCSDVAGDYCLINREDVSRLERGLA